MGVLAGRQSWVWGAIVVGLIIRVVLLPAPGFPDDVAAFEGWALALGTSGTSGFYADTTGMRYPVLDYPPGYMFVLLLVGKSYIAFCHCTDVNVFLRMFVKLPAVLADFGLAFVACAMTLPFIGYRAAYAVLVALLVLPPLWLVSADWGQVDSVAVLTLALAIWAALVNRWILVWPLFVITMLIKPGAAPLIPILLIWEWRATGFGAAFLLGAAGGVAIAFLSTVPFMTDHHPIASAQWLFERYLNGVNKYPNSTTGGFTLFGVAGNFFQSDARNVLGLPLHYWGIVLVLAALSAIAVKLWSVGRGTCEFSKANALGACYVALVGFFILSTRMHERYLMPGLVIGIIAAAFDRRYVATVLIFVCTFTINCVFILRGFYGGVHHPITLLVAHAVSAVNVVTFVTALATYLRTNGRNERPLFATGLASASAPGVARVEQVDVAGVPAAQ